MSQRRFHLVLDCNNVGDLFLNDEKFLKKFIEEVAEKVDMTILYGPISIAGIPENPGVTAFSIIDFSDIMIHTFTKTKELCFEVFSCKEFDYKKIYYFVKETLRLYDEDINRAVVDYNGKPEL